MVARDDVFSYYINGSEPQNPQNHRVDKHIRNQTDDHSPLNHPIAGTQALAGLAATQGTSYGEKGKLELNKLVAAWWLLFHMSGGSRETARFFGGCSGAS